MNYLQNIYNGTLHINKKHKDHDYILDCTTAYTQSRNPDLYKLLNFGSQNELKEFVKNCSFFCLVYQDLSVILIIMII